MKAETEENVKFSLACEAQTFIRYRLYAEKARAEGLPLIAQLFEDIAHEEAFRHGRILSELLSTIDSTPENLRHAMNSEEYQFRYLYKAFAEAARKMGDDEVAKIFDTLRQAEMRHHAAFDAALMRLP
ncbi:MAG: rubrerythrin family protein [Chloroflexi bacterium]|nr:rubrerythrin family protein [Chloroflexota bacterium]